MPGIAGIVGTGSRCENEHALTLMVNCMMHEPFYVSGTYINEEFGLWLGFVNQEGSFADCLPIWNEKRDICILFS